MHSSKLKATRRKTMPRCNKSQAVKRPFLQKNVVPPMPASQTRSAPSCFHLFHFRLRADHQLQFYHIEYCAFLLLFPADIVTSSSKRDGKGSNLLKEAS
ncbi:hypothetical protein TNIN_454571 [Trichonephila inaurata madagascariensis]|uniref:Uncharacterized protein n=1 Tax=Trichonephila inaurata madagascariensis TaxID=2747483 RepID=A0A8X6YJT1_9ARAC|nr:hypothetical protein TNIN_454571 [Trichonephila inaurata madagascariensis]